MNHIALSRNDFDTLDPIHIETGLGIVVAVCLILGTCRLGGRAVETNSQANEENQSRTSRRIDGHVDMA